MKRLIPVLFLVLLPAAEVPAQRWFPFTLPWDDAVPTVIDASGLLVDYPGQDPLTAIQSRGHVVARADGHFYFSRTGRRARFWGVNFTFNANFPDHASAEKVAARLAKLGFNLVRFHHMDYFARPDGIWDPRYFPNDTQHLDPEQLDRWDYLVHQLRRHGIYVNINLKVARHFGPGDGIADTHKFTTNYFFRGVSHYHPRMIELQRDYARQLLLHRNPYTGLTYAEDPAVFCVEITNEDSLFGSLLSDELNFDPDRADSLPLLYSQELDQLWNRWLRDRYATDQALAAAWESDEPPVDGSDRVRNGRFSEGLNHWSVYAIGDQAQASYSVEAGAGPDGSPALRVDVSRSDGVDWHVQAIQTGHSIEQGHRYEITFKAKASAAANIRLDLMKGEPEWQNYGLSQAFTLTPGWREYTARFIANETDPSTARITFELGAAARTIWLDDITFREVRAVGLDIGESLSSQTVRRPPRGEFGRYSERRNLDLMRFYHQLDLAYFTGMRRYLKQDLGVRALVSGTAPWWAFLGDVAIQKELDFVDGHYYWDHPWWPSVPAWSPTGWVISNQSFLNNLDSLLNLAAQAFKGKPFTVSEFNQSFPNRYALEGPLLMALVGAYQDWDAVYLFDYAGSTAGYRDTFTRSFFSLAGNPVKTGQMPIAARIFLGGQVRPAGQRLEIDVNLEEAWLGYIQGRTGAADFLKGFGLHPAAFLESGLRIRSFTASQTSRFETRPLGSRVATDDGALTWDRGDPSRSRLEIRGEGVQGAIGFLYGRRIDFGDWSFQVTGRSPEHAAVVLQVPDGVAWRESPRYLLSVWSEHQNTGQVWNAAGNSLDNRWGTAPSLIREVEVEFALSRAPDAEVWALDERGQRRARVSASSRTAAATVFHISTWTSGTFWFEVELQPPSNTTHYSPADGGVGQLYTDRSEPELRVGWLQAKPAAGQAPAVTALMEYSVRGILTSLVRIPSGPPAVRWDFPLVVEPGKGAAVAVINPSGQGDRTVVLTLRSGGQQTRVRSLTLTPGASEAQFLEELFGPLGNLTGILTATADPPVGVLLLRSRIGAQGEYFLTPITPLEPSGIDSVYLSQLAGSGVYSTDVLVTNTAASPVQSRFLFRSADGAPVPVGGHAEILLELAPGQVAVVTIPRGEEEFYGYGVVELVSGPQMPAVSAVITQYRGTAVISETAIPALPAGREHRVLCPERRARWTALAALNPGEVPVQVSFEFLPNPEQPSPPEARVLTLAPGERRSFFVRELWPGMELNGTSFLQVGSTGPVSVLPLLGSYNQRGDFLLSSLVGGTEGVPALPETLVIGRLLSGLGYRMLLFWDSQQAGEGSFRFFDTSGEPLWLGFRR